MSEELGHVPKFVRLKAMDCFVLRNKHMVKFIVYYLSIFTILHHSRFSAVFSSPLHFPSPFSYFFPFSFYNFPPPIVNFRLERKLLVTPTYSCFKLLFPKV